MSVISRREQLIARCAEIKSDRDAYVKDSGPWVARDKRLDRALAQIWALGPVEA